MKILQKNRPKTVSFEISPHYAIEQTRKLTRMKANIFILVFMIFLAGGKLAAQELQPSETHALMNVLVTNMKDVPSEGDEISFVTQNGEKISGISNKDGKFQVLVKKGTTYDINYKSIEFDEKYSKIEVPAGEGMMTMNCHVKYGFSGTYTLSNVFFDTDKATLRPESNESLDHLANLMQNKKTMKIELSGHTDSEGDDQSNQTLSENRAKAVRNYLIKKGIASNRITAKGYGETQPVASNETPEGET